MRLQYNNVVIRSLYLRDIVSCVNKQEMLRCVLRPNTRTYVIEVDDVVIGYCKCEIILDRNICFVTPNVPDECKADVVNGMRFILFPRKNCSTIAYAITGDARDAIFDKLDNAVVVDDVEDYRLVCMFSNARSVI